ncbi:MAG: hypothetical protein IJR97_02985 [Clostridia bacterium]|nr:hypothetical protein [Clostridia bacterium]
MDRSGIIWKNTNIPSGTKPYFTGNTAKVQDESPGRLIKIRKTKNGQFSQNRQSSLCGPLRGIPPGAVFFPEQAKPRSHAGPGKGENAKKLVFPHDFAYNHRKEREQTRFDRYRT